MEHISHTSEIVTVKSAAVLHVSAPSCVVGVSELYNTNAVCGAFVLFESSETKTECQKYLHVPGFIRSPWR